MINIESNDNGYIVKITDNWCDNTTINKIKEIKRRLKFRDDNLIDWEILVCNEVEHTNTNQWDNALEDVLEMYGQYIEIHLLFVRGI